MFELDRSDRSLSDEGGGRGRLRDVTFRGLPDLPLPLLLPPLEETVAIGRRGRPVERAETARPRENDRLVSVDPYD